MIIEAIKTLITIPSGINGLVAGRTALKAHVQLKQDVVLYMNHGMSKINLILGSASELDKKRALSEYKKWSLPKSDPNRITSLSVRGFPPPHQVQQLFALKNSIDAILATSTVFLDGKLRSRLIRLRNRLNDYEISFENHQDKRFHYARCFILRAKMRTIKKLASI